MEKIKTCIKREAIILFCGLVITGFVLALCRILKHISLELYGEGSLQYIFGVEAETFLYIFCMMMIFALTFINIVSLIGKAILEVIDKEVK